LHRTEPAAQQVGVSGEVFFDLLPDLLAIHMDREIAFVTELDGGARVLVGQPPQRAGGANRRIRRCRANVFQR
jgi:hypothetical protein